MNRLLPSALKRFDWISVVIIVTLLSLGIFTIQSTISAQSGSNQLLKQNLINIQLLSALIGFFGYFMISSINYRYIQFFSVPMYLISLILLVLVLVIGEVTRGSTRWISLGPINIQPSSIAVITTIIMLATFFKTIGNKVNLPLNIGLSLLIAIIPAALVALEPDLGSALVILTVWLVLLHLTPINIRWILLIYFIGMICLPIGWTRLADYQKERVYTFLNPLNDPSGSGYNVLQAMIAVGSGQLFGRGWGEGTQSHLQYLPEQHTDFIFATFAEEQGFIGAMVLVVLYAILLIKIFQLIWKTNDYFGQLILMGIFIWLFTHIIVNIGMNIGVLPITGIPLPLISYGGSAVVMTLIGLGIVQSIYRHSEV